MNNNKSNEVSNKGSVPQLVKLNKGFKLAEQWVNNMSKLEEDDRSAKAKLQCRPPRLGVGAAVPRESKIVHSSDPIERKLRAKLETDKKKVIKYAEEPSRPALDGSSRQDSDDGEPESKTEAFAKKRPLNWTSSLKLKKKHK